MHLLVNMTKRTTIKDISKKLKIHHSTVSRALRNSLQVKEETKKRIVKYTKNHGFHLLFSDRPWPIVHRNLALAYFNKTNDVDGTIKALETPVFAK